MGWSGSLTASSAVGTSITFTPDTTTKHAYTVASFTAPVDGVYKFTLKGSGGALTGSEWSNYWTSARGSGGTGGSTTGYLSLKAGNVVYVGAGGYCSAAFVSKISVSTLAGASSASNLWFVAGAGGDGGSMWDNAHQWSNNNSAGAGGAGGGSSGAGASSGGSGGSQSAGGSGSWNNGSFGTGGAGGYANHDGGLSGRYSTTAGDGGDGLYGGGSGGYCYGGGGGSGYINASSITVNGTTYTNSTSQGGGAGSNATGSVVVTYVAKGVLPVNYNGTQLTKIIYNGTEITSLIYNGTKLF